MADESDVRFHQAGGRGSLAVDSVRKLFRPVAACLNAGPHAPIFCTNPTVPVINQPCSMRGITQHG